MKFEKKINSLSIELYMLNVLITLKYAIIIYCVQFNFHVHDSMAIFLCKCYVNNSPTHLPFSYNESGSSNKLLINV